MTVSIVVPVWPHAPGILEMALETLRLFREHTPGAELVVVHNGGPAADREALEGACDVYLRLYPNKGYSPAVNAGMDAASGDILVVGSDDAQVTEGWLEPVLEALSVGVDIASPTHPEDGQNHHHDEFCGVLFAMSRQVWEAVGPLDTDAFRVRKGDQDFAIRASMAGFTLALVPESRFVHVAPHHSKAAVGEKRLTQEGVAFRERYGVASYRRWRKLHP